MAYDDLLLHVGEFGRYQKYVYLLCLLGSVPNGFHTLSNVFYLIEPDFRCAVPGLNNDTFHIQDEAHAQMVNASIPYDLKTGKYSECSLYKVEVPPHSNTSGVLDTDTNSTGACARWVYSKEDFTETMTTSLDLVCDRKLFRNHANMMLMAGYLVGSLTGGVVSDVIGRRKSFLLFMGAEIVCAVSTAFVESITSLLILRFTINLCSMAVYLAIFVLVSEFVGPRKRAFAALGTMFGWCAGIIILVPTTYFIRDWRVAQLVFACPSVLFISFYWLLPESPRWLMSKGRYAEARQIITRIAKVNKVKLTEEVFLSTERSWKAEEKTAEPVKKLKVWHVLRYPRLALRLAIISFNWFVNGLVYYGLTLNIGTLVEGNIFLNIIVMVSMEFVTYVLVTAIFERFGRKTLYCSSLLLGGIACLATIISVLTDSKELWWINSLLACIGRSGVTASFAFIYVFTVELLPTELRNSGLGFSSFCARIGSIASSYIVVLGSLAAGKLSHILPLTLFGGMAIVAGVLCLWLPETRNQKLMDTLEDLKQSSMSKKPSSGQDPASWPLRVSGDEAGTNKPDV